VLLSVTPDSKRNVLGNQKNKINMKGVIKLVTICFYVVFCGCQNGDLKTPSTKTQISEKQSETIVDEMVSFNEGVNKRKNEDAASNGSNIAVAVVANPVSKTNHNQKESIETRTENYSLVGTWVNYFTQTIKGVKMPCRVFRTYKNNGIESLYTICTVDGGITEGKSSTTIATYEHKNNILYETDEKGIKYESNIEWTNANKFTLIELSGVKHIFIRYSPPGGGKTTCVHCHGKKTITCHYCNGAGKVEYIVQKERYNNITQRYELYNETETQICQACNNGQITCNVCAGKGSY